MDKKHILPIVILTYFVRDSIATARAARRNKQQNLDLAEAVEKNAFLCDLVFTNPDVVLPDHVLVDTFIKGVEITTKYAAMKK
jgi:hypothetical protein